MANPDYDTDNDDSTIEDILRARRRANINQRRSTTDAVRATAPFNAPFTAVLFPSSNSETTNQVGLQGAVQSNSPFQTSLFGSSSSKQNDQAGTPTSASLKMVFSTSLFARSKPKEQVRAQVPISQQANQYNPSFSDGLFVQQPQSEALPPEYPQALAIVQEPTSPTKKTATKRRRNKLTKADGDVTSPSTPRRKKATQKADSNETSPSTPSRKKPGPKPKPKTPPEDSDLLRQRLVAQRLIDIESKGYEESMDDSLFGSEVETDPEVRKQRLEDEKAAASAAREAKMMELLEKEEQNKQKALEKQREAAEQAEMKKLERAKEEAAKKLKREEERKKQQVAEALELEEKRRLSAERIGRIRLKAQRDAEEKARNKHEGVEASAVELEKLKMKQEESRRLAASLNMSKLPPSPARIVQRPSNVPPMPTTIDENVKKEKAVSFAVQKPEQPDRGAKSTASRNVVQETSHVSRISSILDEIGAPWESSSDMATASNEAKENPNVSPAVVQIPKVPGTVQNSVSRVPTTSATTRKRPGLASKMSKASMEATKDTNSTPNLALGRPPEASTPRIEIPSIESQDVVASGKESRESQDQSKVFDVAKGAILEMVNKGIISPQTLTISELPAASKGYVTRGTTMSRATTPESGTTPSALILSSVSATSISRTFVVTIQVPAEVSTAVAPIAPPLRPPVPQAARLDLNISTSPPTSTANEVSEERQKMNAYPRSSPLPALDQSSERVQRKKAAPTSSPPPSVIETYEQSQSNKLAPKPHATSEAQNAKRREQYAKKAREKRLRQELIQAAEEEGEDLDEMELELRLQLELEETQETSEKTKSHGTFKTPEESSEQSPLPQERPQQDDTEVDSVQHHPIFSSEEQMRRQQQDEDIRNDLMRLGLRPVQRAPSIESDEDEDPEPQTSDSTPETQMPAMTSESEESAILSASQIPNVASHPSPAKKSYDHVESQEEHEPPPKKRKLDSSDDTSHNAYTIQEATNKDGEEVVQSELGSYPNIKDATWAFRKLRTKYKKRKIQAFTECEDNECLSCTIFYENDDAPYQQTIWLEPKPPKNSKEPKFVVSRHIYHKHYDLMVGEESVQDTVTTEGTFTSRLMANKFAHDGVCAYLKPKVPNLDHITLWKEHCKQVTQYKENLDKGDGVFGVEIETGDTPWLDVDGFSFVVEMK